MSTRTGETLFEIRMLDGAMVVWGRRYRPSEFCATLSKDGAMITLDGTLRDERGPVVKFGDEATICAGYSVEMWGAADGLRRKLDTGSHLMQADRP